MKSKHLFLTAILLVFSMLVVAEPVDPMRALEVAEQFAPQSAKAKRIKSKTAPEQSYEIVYTHHMPNSDRAAFYVVKLGEKGFVIISADDVANPILGYSYTNSWPTSISAQGDTLLPPQVLSYLNDMALQIETAIEKYPNLESSEEWNNIGQKAVRKSRARKSADALPDSVGPLLTTTWGQGQYYNALCPEDAGGEDGHVPTGCVATAMAQIINYWGQKEEIKTRGIHSYDSQYGNLRVNYDSTFYDFSNMPDALTAESTPEQVNAVAKLMYECGVAVNMQYSTGASGTLDVFDVRAALTNYFNFSPNLKCSDKTYWQDEKWIQLLKQNIASERPIFYSGVNRNYLGHSFLCDGYNINNYFHFNFGWNGFADGWYLLDCLEYEDLDFTFNQSAMLDIEATTGHSMLYAQQSLGQKSTFVISETIHLRELLANNQYPTAGGWMYNGDHTFTFLPQDSTKQLIVYIDENIELDSYVYDGEYAIDSMLIREYVRYAGYFPTDMDFRPVVSTKNAITIRIECAAWDNYYTHFIIEEYNECERPSNCKVIYRNDSLVLSWEGDADAYEIEYGKSGFTQGTGKMLSTNTTQLAIKDIEPLQKYDFYIRSSCGGVHSPWTMPVSFITPGVKWLDVVIEKPNEFCEDSNGNVVIASEEAFAWFAKVANNNHVSFKNKNIKLNKNLNMGAYEWVPIENFNGCFDGQGFYIDSLKSFGDYSGGIFSKISDGGVVKNTNLINSHIERDNSIAAGISSSIQNASIYNCFVKGTFASYGSYGAGMVAHATNSKIMNCVVSGDILGTYSTSGICCVQDNGIIRNCYSAAQTNTLGVGAASVCADNYNGSMVANCYANYYRCGNREIAGATYEGIYHSLSKFRMKNNEWVLDTPIDIGGRIHTKLIDALNYGLEAINIEGLKLWEEDKECINDGMPVFSSEEYQVTCPNIDDFSLQNVEKDGDYGVKVEWDNDEDDAKYEILCCRLLNQTLQTVDTVGSFIVANHVDTILGLSIGETYLFMIRAVCDSVHHSAWSLTKRIVFDIPYWTDVVTSQPEGYKENVNGKITISTAEGLAWLCSVVNGVNGQAGSDLSGKIITINENIDMGKYKWSPLKQCRQCVFDGTDHSINNLYINELMDDIGFFARIDKSILINMHFKQACIKGHAQVGTICGYGEDSQLINCTSFQSEINAYSVAGGLTGVLLNCQINRCATSGNILAETGCVGGISANINGGPMCSSLKNSYSHCNIVTGTEAGGLVGSVCASVENCYAHNQITSSMWSGGIFGSTNNLLVKNCYTTFYMDVSPGYLVNDQPPFGTVFGYNYSLQAENVYFPSQSVIPVIGSNEKSYDWGRYLFVDTASYDIYSDKLLLTKPITVNDKRQENLLDALNAWVDANNSKNQFLHWVADTANMNDGFPILAVNESKYVITFCNDDGTILQQDTLEFGEIPQYRGEIPTKDSTEYMKYSFSSWTPELQVVTENITYTAQYAIMCNVSFYNWDSTLLQSSWYNYGEYPSYNGDTPTRGEDAQYTYSFIGWSPQIYRVSSAQSYYAQYESTLNQYEINFYDWDGTLLQSSMMNYGEWPTYYNSDPWREADEQYTYTFSGWDPELSAVTGYTSYYAQYEATAITTAIENTQSNEVKTYKILRDNKIFIIRGDKMYSILGEEM